MRKIVYIAICLVGVWFIFQTHILDTIFSLLFIGLIPGTNVSIPAPLMLFGYAAIGYVGLLVILKRQPVLATETISTKPGGSVKSKAKSKRVNKRPTRAKKTKSSKKH